jgi:hypothetical protein
MEVQQTKKVTKIFSGTLVHSVGVQDKDFQIVDDRVIGVDDAGTIAFIEPKEKLATLASEHGFEKQDVIELGSK